MRKSYILDVAWMLEPLLSLLRFVIAKESTKLTVQSIITVISYDSVELTLIAEN